MTENKAQRSCLSGGGLLKLKASPTEKTLRKIVSDGDEVLITAGYTCKMREEAGAYLLTLAQSFGINITAVVLSPQEEFERTVRSSPMPPCAFSSIGPNGEPAHKRVALVLAMGASTFHIGTVTPDLSVLAHHALAAHDVKGAVHQIKVMLGVLKINKFVVCGCPTYIKNVQNRPISKAMSSPQSVAYTEGWAAISLSELVTMAQDPELGLKLSGPGGSARTILEALNLSDCMGLLSL